MREIDNNIGYGKWQRIFDTELGSAYFREVRTGLWMKRVYDGTLSGVAIYFGSINPGSNDALDFEGKKVLKVGPKGIIAQIRSGEVPGFEPSFKVGSSPIGIFGCSFSDLKEISRGKICLDNDRMLNNGIHVGHPISQVYKHDMDMSYNRPNWAERLFRRRFSTPIPPQFARNA